MGSGKLSSLWRIAIGAFVIAFIAACADEDEPGGGRAPLPTSTRPTADTEIETALPSAPTSTAPSEEAPGCGEPDRPIPGRVSDGVVRVAIYCGTQFDRHNLQLVERTVPDDSTPLATALSQLLLGVTPEEHEAGFRSAFSSFTAGQLRSVDIEDTVVVIDFTTDLIRTNNFATTALGAAVGRQIEATVFAFPEITGLEFRVDGDRWCGWEATCDGASVPIVTRADICLAATATRPDAPAEVPAATAATVTAIVRAAQSCDVEALSQLASDDFVFNWVGQGDLAAELATREVHEDPPPLVVLVELLRLAPARSPGLDGVWVWPAAHADADAGAEPTPTQKAELAALYGVTIDEVWSEFGPVGRFIGIDDAGNWRYFAPVD